MCDPKNGSFVAHMARAAIIIPHYNDVTRLGRCLTALFASATASGADDSQAPDAGPYPVGIEDVEIVVVDNASTESLDQVIADHPDVRFIVELQKGAAAARNRGVAETTAPLIWFLNSDCLPASDWLATAGRVAGQADLVGGAIDVFDETPPPRSGAEAFEAVFGFDYRRYIDRYGFAVTANLLTRRDVFEVVGPFVSGRSEDVDWCWRARAAGYTLVCSEALRVGHPSRPDWPALRRKWMRMVREGFVLNGKSPKRRFFWIAKACAMPFSILRHAPRLFRSPALETPRERWAGLRTLVRLRLLRMIWMLRQSVGMDV